MCPLFSFCMCKMWILLAVILYIMDISCQCCENVVEYESIGGGMKICALASGSKGNATLVHNGDRAVLVDDGITFAMLKERLTARDVPLSDIKAVLITHEHSDHIKGVATLARHLRVPVYAPEQCIESIIAKCGGKA